MTDAMLHIRRATAADVGLILSFIRELAEYERLSYAVVATEEGLGDALFGARPAADVLIAESDGAPAGFALFFQNFSTFTGRPGLYLEDLFVRPPFRRRGIARALLARLAQIAVERRCARVEWAVLDWNQPALALYRSVGAEALDDWTVHRLHGESLQILAREAH